MVRWIAATMDGVLGVYATRERAIQDNLGVHPVRVRRLGRGDYEVRSIADEGHCRLFWVMTEDVAWRHGFSIAEMLPVRRAHGEDSHDGHTTPPG